MIIWRLIFPRANILICLAIPAAMAQYIDSKGMITLYRRRHD